MTVLFATLKRPAVWVNQTIILPFPHEFGISSCPGKMHESLSSHDEMDHGHAAPVFVSITGATALNCVKLKT